jgi:hypothetical protein
MASALQPGWDFCARDLVHADAVAVCLVLTAPPVLGTLWPCRYDGGGGAIARRDPGEGVVIGRRIKRGRIPKLTHSEAANYLVEYHFGRLSPEMNAAVEEHVRGCPLCRRDGLTHAATEKREIQRHIRRVKPTFRRKLSRRGTTILLSLAVLVLVQLIVLALLHGGAITLSGHP